MGNNVLAQVPDLNDFVKGMKMLLKPEGVITLEFPHLMRLMGRKPVRHDLSRALLLLLAHDDREDPAAHGLSVFDVEELPTHGGSLRVYARHFEDASKPVGDRVREILAREARRLRHAGVLRPLRGAGQGDEAQAAGLPHQSQARGEVRSPVTAHPGKGNTLLNYCGIRVRLPRLHRGPQPAQARQIPARNPRPDLPPRKDQGNKAGLRADPALESEDRNHGAGVVYPRLGWALRGAYSGGGGLRLTPSLHRGPRRRAELAGSRLYDVVLDLGRDSPTCLLWASSGTLDTST